MASVLDVWIDNFVSEDDTFLWLWRRDLKGEIEGEIIEAQDQALQTKYHATKLLHTKIDTKCRLYKQFDESVEGIISACPVLAKEQYVKKHDRFYVYGSVHHNIFYEITNICSYMQSILFHC